MFFKTGNLMLLTCYGSSSQELSDKLNRDLLAVVKWLNNHKLTLNLEKTLTVSIFAQM